MGSGTSGKLSGKHGCLLALSMMLCVGAQAQSFDCEKASTQVEKTVCADSALALADDRLASAYKQVMVALPLEVKEIVRSGEATWAQSVGDICATKPAFQENFTTCLKRMYKERTTLLDKMVVSQGGMRFVMLDKTLMARDSAGVTVDKATEENAGFGTLHAGWPQALSAMPEWTAWNAAMLAETKKMAGGSGDVDEPWKKLWAADQETEVTATVDGMSAQVISAKMLNEGMGHNAAHPNEASHEFLWMLKEQRKLKASDVFVAGTSWESSLERRCKASLKLQFGKDYDSFAGENFQKVLDAVVLNPENWTMDAKGMTIRFPDYTITPRANAVDPVNVPWVGLKGMLVAGFVPPK